MSRAEQGRWARRAVTLPAFFVAWVLAVAGLPAWITIAIIVDLARALAGQTRAPTARAVLFFLSYLTCEVAGITAATGIWIAAKLVRADDARFVAWNFALQRRWTSALLRAAVRLYGLRVIVEGEDAIEPGPLLLFMRHNSVADTVLPGVYVSGRGIRLRYVLKRELLSDPCLDLVGLRLRNHFVRRASRDASEVAAVGALADDLAANEGVLIYPEGTRFSERRRRAIIDKLERVNDPHLEAAKRLERVLPPRLAGPLALLAHRTLDVLFCAHVGFESASSLPAFLAGKLIGKTIRVAFWRVRASEIGDDRAAWLYDAWARMDAWVRAHEER